MKWIFGKLEWFDYPGTEFDKIADYKFNNGIKVRIVRGEFANSGINAPFELILKKPHRNHISIPSLRRSTLNELLNELDNLDTDSI